MTHHVPDSLRARGSHRRRRRQRTAGYAGWLLGWLLLAGGAAAETRQQLNLTYAQDSEAGQTTALDYQLQRNTWGAHIGLSNGRFDQLAPTQEDTGVLVDAQSQTFLFGLYRVFGTLELSADLQLATVDDGSETARYQAGLAYLGQWGRVGVTIEALEVSSEIVLEQRLFRFSRLVTRTDDRNGWGLGLAGDFLLSDTIHTYGGLRLRRYDDGSDLSSRVRLVTNTPLNDAQRVSDRIAFVGLGWTGQRLLADLQLGLDDAADFDDRTLYGALTFGLSLAEKLSTALTLGQSRSDIFTDSQFVELTLTLNF